MSGLHLEIRPRNEQGMNQQDRQSAMRQACVPLMYNQLQQSYQSQLLPKGNVRSFEVNEVNVLTHGSKTLQPAHMATIPHNVASTRIINDQYCRTLNKFKGKIQMNKGSNSGQKGQI